MHNNYIIGTELIGWISQYILHIDSCRGCVNHLLSRTDEKNCWMNGVELVPLNIYLFIFDQWFIVTYYTFRFYSTAPPCNIMQTGDHHLIGRNRELSLSVIDSKWITMLVPISSLTKSSRELNQDTMISSWSQKFAVDSFSRM